MKINSLLIRQSAQIVLLLALSLFAFGQNDAIKNITASIEKNPASAELYLQRGDLYTDLWNAEQKPENIVNIARAVADYSKYLKLKPNDAQAYVKRADARDALFMGANSFTLADLQKAIQLNPQDAETKDRLPVYQAEYRRMYRTKECVDGRMTNGFQGHPSDTPLTHLAEYLDVEMSNVGGGSNSEALKAIACGANVNYVYKQTGRSEFSGFNNFRIEHIIAMLEAGAKTENRNQNGETVLMQTFDLTAQTQAKIDEDFYEKLKIVLQYGANLKAKNKKGRNVLYFARKTKSTELVAFLKRVISEL